MCQFVVQVFTASLVLIVVWVGLFNFPILLKNLISNRLPGKNTEIKINLNQVCEKLQYNPYVTIRSQKNYNTSLFVFMVLFIRLQEP